MKALKISVFAALLVSSLAAKAQTVDEIMGKAQTAMGSTDAWNKIKTLKMEGGMSVQGNDIGVIQTMILGKAVRTDISVMGMNGYSIITKTAGWSYMPFAPNAKVDTMKPDMVKAAQSQLDLQGKNMMAYKEKGTKAEYIGKDTVNKALCYKIKFTDKEGMESTSFIDATTYYLVRVESKVKVEDQEQEVAMGFSNYKKLDVGVVMPMTIATDQGEITFKTVDINKPIDEKIFKPETKN